jgi:hypothetical protein
LQSKPAALYLTGLFAVVLLLGILAGIAIPHAAYLSYHAEADARNIELLKIQAAVGEMLRASPVGRVASVGLVKDLSLVRTQDNPPLLLTDFLPDDVPPMRSNPAISTVLPRTARWCSTKSRWRLAISGWQVAPRPGGKKGEMGRGIFHW